MKSFLKWAGGKSKILPQIQSLLPNNIENYIEPFLGSGVVLMNVVSNNKLGNDTNKDLINTFLSVRDHKDELLNRCRELFINGNDSVKFYENRDKFNKELDVLQRSALFIYLNRHCFNGLCRYNKSGQYNVPFGRYKTTYLPEEEINNVNKILHNVELKTDNAFDIIKNAKEGDVVYCDPPYYPLKPATFKAYTVSDFSIIDQNTLAILAEKASRRGVFVIISNHDLPETQKLYNKHIVSSFDVQRNISSGQRNKVKELLAVYKPS